MDARVCVLCTQTSPKWVLMGRPMCDTVVCEACCDTMQRLFDAPPLTCTQEVEYGHDPARTRPCERPAVWAPATGQLCCKHCAATYYPPRSHLQRFVRLRVF